MDIVQKENQINILFENVDEMDDLEEMCYATINADDTSSSSRESAQIILDVIWQEIHGPGQ